MNVRIIAIVGLLFFSFSKGFTQETVRNQTYYIGLEVMEPIVTHFNSFGISLGMHQSSFDFGANYLHLNLPVSHLSHPRVGSVDGENVSGQLRLVRLYTNYHPFEQSGNYFLKSLYLSGGAGYMNLNFEHEVTKERHGTKSMILGSGIGIFQRDLFKIKGLFLDFTIPVMYLFNGLEEQYLEATKVNQQYFLYQGFVFIGYEF